MDTPGGVFVYCVALLEQKETNDLLQCVSNELEGIQKSTSWDLKSWMLVICGSLVFGMQAGFAMVCAGCVRKKNVQSTMLKNLMDACGVALAFFSVGFGFAFGGQSERTDTTFIGRANFFNVGVTDFGFWFYEYSIAATCITIVAGALAERCQMTAYFLYSIFLSGFVYPIVCHAIWSNNGILSPYNLDPMFGMGAIDFAGSAVVHLTGGVCALFATLILGSRRGRFYNVTTGSLLDEPKEIKGHSMSLQMLGTMLLWFGWCGFNPGSALLIPREEFSGRVGALAAVNTSLAAAGGATSALFLQLYCEQRRTGEVEFNLVVALNGALSGLVAVTAGCATLENWAAVIVGFVAGPLYVFGSKFCIRMKIDDAVDAIPVHMVNGMWGVIAAGLFSSPELMKRAYDNDQYPGLLYSFVGKDGAMTSPDFSLLGCQIFCIIFIVAWTTLTMLPFFLWLNYMGWFRAESTVELVGQDIAFGEIVVEERKNLDEEKELEFLEAYTSYKQNLRRKRLGKTADTEESTDDDLVTKAV